VSALVPFIVCTVAGSPFSVGRPIAGPLSSSLVPSEASLPFVSLHPCSPAFEQTLLVGPHTLDFPESTDPRSSTVSVTRLLNSPRRTFFALALALPPVITFPPALFVTFLCFVPVFPSKNCLVHAEQGSLIFSSRPSVFVCAHLSLRLRWMIVQRPVVGCVPFFSGAYDERPRPIVLDTFSYVLLPSILSAFTPIFFSSTLRRQWTLNNLPCYGNHPPMHLLLVWVTGSAGVSC